MSLLFSSKKNTTTPKVTKKVNKYSHSAVRKRNQDNLRVYVMKRKTITMIIMIKNKMKKKILARTNTLTWLRTAVQNAS
jgi:hypothetical protein